MTTETNDSVKPAINEVQVNLESNDGKVFTVSKAIAVRSTLIKNMLEDVGGEPEDNIPLPNVTGATLEHVVAYCTHHKDDARVTDEEKKLEKKTDAGKDDIDAWDKKFLEAFDKETLYGVILASNYLDIPTLLDVSCKHVANQIKGMTTEEMREYFGVENDFTPEEEAQIREENQWLKLD